MKKSTIIIIAAIGVVTLILAGLLIKSHSDMQEMVDVFTEEKENLLNDYQDLYLDYDSLRRYDTDLNEKLDQERERVAQLQEELKTVKATNARRIKELQGELTTLRTVMRTFVVQIDSLNQTNIRLTQENNEMKDQVARVKQSYNALQSQNQSLAQQVEIASRLEAKVTSTDGLTNKEKKTTSISKIAKVVVNFIIDKNVSAQVGMKKVYLRLTRPDGQLLMHSKDDLFKYEDSQINFSAMREVEYGGEETTSYIVYKVDSGELMAGTYDIEIFCQGERIAKGSWTIK
ncbi:MAG: hypothetical protein MJZ15_08495 [Bacteroidales bacterium]|nr:hypothetical protein [Bacteroidales bacterium]